MAGIVNLRQVRKQKARRDKEERAQENRIRFGRTKSERQKLSADAALEQRRIDSAKRDKPGEP
jgi:hypothetical protein